MSTDSVVLEHLQAIRTGMDRLHNDMREVRRRLGYLEGQYAYLSIRVDRMDERMEEKAASGALTRAENGPENVTVNGTGGNGEHLGGDGSTG
ncbi:MAG: hypothetical protein AAF565_06110 [Pseudomonadota bacterium]